MHITRNSCDYDIIYPLRGAGRGYERNPFPQIKTEIYYRIVYFYCFKCSIILFMQFHVECVKIMSGALSGAELVAQFYYIIL